jgi:UDP-N-acetylmuramoylalanine--D-glutamate ligase
MEELGRYAGVRVIDNGVSTTPDSTISALRTLEPGCTLLIGGAPKQDLPLDALVAVARERVCRVVVFGAAARSFPAAFAACGLPVEAATSLREAVGTAFSGLRPGETLLFSPACASFDAYLNFEERARDFRSALPS